MYVEPKATIEEFVANEYVGACQAEIQQEYYEEGISRPCSTFYIDENGDHTLQKSEMVSRTSDNTDKYIFTDYKLGWSLDDSNNLPQEGDTTPTCWVIKKQTGGGTHYGAFLLKYIVIVNRS